MAYLTIIIGIEDVLVEAVFLPDTALRALGIGAILEDVGIEVTVHLTTGVTIVLIESTKAMIIIEHIVNLQLG